MDIGPSRGLVIVAVVVVFMVVLSALTRPLRSMMSDQHLDGIHVVDGRLFAWQGQTHHKVATLPGRLAALAASAAGLPLEPVAS